MKLDEITLKEIEYKINLLEEINSKTLNSVYWTIALVGAIFSAIVALNFYQNLIINSKKIQALKDEYDEKFLALENELRKKIL